jgi:hypothetical protein
VIPTPTGSWPPFLPFGPKALPPGIWILIVAWSLVWKGVALWRAARAGQTAWFIALLLVHTVGLLEIAYLLFFAGRTSVAVIGEPATPWREAPPGTAPPAAENRGSRARP